MRIGVLLLLLLAMFTTATVAQDRDHDLTRLKLAGSDPINVHFVDAKLSDAMKLLSNMAGIEIRISPDVTNVPPLSVDLKRTDFKTVFTATVALAKLDYSVLAEKTILIVNKQ